MVNAVGRHRDDDEELDLRELVSRLWQGRWIIIASVVFFTCAFAAVAFLMTPVYRATAVLVPASVDRGGSLGSALGSLGGPASIAGIEIGSMGVSRTEEALAVLRSRQFTEVFITEHQLMPEIFPRQWDAKAKTWNPGIEQPTLVRAYKRFDELRTATEDRKTGLIKVQVEWKDPAKAAFLVNELIARLNAVMRARTIARTDAYVGYLQKELAATSAVETRQAISRLMEAQINDRMLANVTEEYAFRVVDKALVPDVSDPARPKRALLIAFGGLAGVFVGALIVFVLASTRTQARS